MIARLFARAGAPDQLSKFTQATVRAFAAAVEAVA